MVKITNGVYTFEVTRGAYEGIYSRQGYHLLEDPEAAQVHQGLEDNATDPDQLFLEEIVEKPVSQWTKNEVKRFVTLKGIDTSGAKNVGEVRELVKAYLDEQE